MRVNKEILKSFKPCEERWRNYLNHYSNFDGAFDEFIDLEKVSYDDKIWVAKKMLNKNQLMHFGLLCAESVLSIFEAKYPTDQRVRSCIEYLKGIKDFSDISESQREEILTHRRAAYAAAADAYAADADAAAAAADAAAYAAAYAAYAAAYAADAAARKSQQELNLELLKIAASI